MTDPDYQRRAVAYVRESTEDQGEGYSPEAQRQGIANYVAANELLFKREYIDFHSGWRGSERRPEFQRMMADAAAGEFDVVLVYHSSRFARDAVVARSYKKLLREKGIDVISVTQHIGDDPRQPTTFLAEGINELFDEYHSVVQSFWTSAGLQEKRRQGELVGSLPWGLVTRRRRADRS